MRSQQFAVDPRCAPQRVLAVHPPDQRSKLGINPGTAAEVAGLPAPVGTETASVPADHSLRLDDDDRVCSAKLFGWQPRTTHCEGFCLDHLIVFDEAQLRSVLRNYASYYNQVRTHLSLDKNASNFRRPQKIGRIAAIPILGGLHHQYVRV